MRRSVIIKGNKYGLLLSLNPDLPFSELLEKVGETFKESAGFFQYSSSIAVSFTGRDLTSQEQDALVESIMENSDLNISCILDGARALEAAYREALAKESGPEPEYDPQFEPEPAAGDEECLPDPGEEEVSKKAASKRDDLLFPENLVGKSGQFYRGTLRSGQRIEVDGSIVILGDINPGAQVTAGGNVVVLGCLKGTVFAGEPSDKEAFVAALIMEPMQIKIGGCIGRSGDQKGRKQRTVRKKNKTEIEAKMAFVEEDYIYIETITRSLINEMSTGEKTKKEIEDE